MSPSEEPGRNRRAEPRIAAAAILFRLGRMHTGRTSGWGADRSPTTSRAIRVAEDLYMIELGTDDVGCRQHSAWSSTGAVVAAVYYRRADGSFTLFRSDADCGSPSQ